MPRLDHVGIATADAERLLDALRDLLGETRYASETLEKDGVRIAFVSGGGAQLELLEALDETSPVARFLRERKGGLHHLAFEVEDIHAMHRRVREAGYAPIDPAPRPGAEGKSVFFVHPGQTGQILIEFCARAAPGLEPVAGALPAGVRRVVRARGSETQTPLLHIATATSPPSPAPDALAERLAPGRIYVAAEADGEPNVPALIEWLGKPSVHLLMQGLPAKPVMDAARADARIEATLWADPDPDAFDAARPVPARALFLTGDSKAGLSAARTLRQRFPTAAIAATSDPALRIALIERHIERYPAPQARAPRP